MGRQTKTAARDEFRRQIALYLRAIRIARGWKQERMALEAGDISHSTIGRAINEKNTLEFPTLLALEKASGIPIPDALRDAAIAYSQPNHPPRVIDVEAEIRGLTAELKTKSPQEQRAALDQIRRALRRVGE